MRRELNIDTWYLAPDVNIVGTIESFGDEQKRTTNVKADVTSWNTHQKTKAFQPLINQLNVLYPKYSIQELWGCTYQQGDFTQSHNHSGFDLAFAWFVDSCSHCSPLVFPNFERPWLPPLAVIKPLQGNLVVFSGKEIHYVSPHTCPHHRMVVSGNLGLINAVG